MRNLPPPHLLIILIASAFIVSCTKSPMKMWDSENQTLSQKVKPNVLECGTGQHWDFILKKCVADCPDGYENDPGTGACIPVQGGPNYFANYAGVQIGYYATSHLLSFNSVTDLNTVLDQLDSDYEQYNTVYENQYPNATALELDSLDSVNNFDEFSPYKNFEGSFLVFTSMRSILDNNETTWLNNNMTGSDPDSLDFTIDNSMNAICNSSYRVIIAGTTYQWTSSGLNAVGSIEPTVVYSPSGSGQCFSNYRGGKPSWIENTEKTRICKLKVAVNACIIRGEAKAKVKSFRKKSNGKWIRSRLALRVRVQGPLLYHYDCSVSKNVDKSKPTQGLKKRKQLKVLERTSSANAYMYLGTFWGYFYTNNPGFSGQRNI